MIERASLAKETLSSFAIVFRILVDKRSGPVPLEVSSAVKKREACLGRIGIKESGTSIIGERSEY